MKRVATAEEDDGGKDFRNPCDHSEPANLDGRGEFVPGAVSVPPGPCFHTTDSPVEGDRSSLQLQ